MNKESKNAISKETLVVGVIIVAALIAAVVITLFITRKFGIKVSRNRYYTYFIMAVYSAIITVLCSVLRIIGKILDKCRNKAVRKEMESAFDEMKQICQKNISKYGKNYSYFREGVNEEKIQEWEIKTGVTMPDSYRAWLKLTGECEICSKTACFYFPDVEKKFSFLPDDCVVIGNAKEGEDIVVFSKRSKRFAIFFTENDTVQLYDNFKDVLNEVTDSILE